MLGMNNKKQKKSKRRKGTNFIKKEIYQSEQGSTNKSSHSFFTVGQKFNVSSPTNTKQNISVDTLDLKRESLNKSAPVFSLVIPKMNVSPQKRTVDVSNNQIQHMNIVTEVTHSSPKVPFSQARKEEILNKINKKKRKLSIIQEKLESSRQFKKQKPKEEHGSQTEGKLQEVSNFNLTQSASEQKNFIESDIQENQTTSKSQSVNLECTQLRKSKKKKPKKSPQKAEVNTPISKQTDSPTIAVVLSTSKSSEPLPKKKKKKKKKSLGKGNSSESNEKQSTLEKHDNKPSNIGLTDSKLVSTMGQNESTKKESVSQTAIDTKKNKKAKEESEKKKALENSVLESKTNQQKSNKSTNHKDKKKPIEESSALEESTSNHQNKARYIKLGKKHKPNLFIDDEATEDTDSDGASKSTNQQDSLDSNSDSSETSIDSSPSRIKNLHKQKRQNVVSDTDEDESDSFERNIEEAAPKEKKIPRHMSPLIENEAIPHSKKLVMPIISKNGPLKVDAAIPNNDKQLKIPKESTILKMFNDGSSSSSSSSASVSMAKEKTVAEPTIADLELLMLDSISKLTAKITDESLIDSINGLKTKMEKLKEKYTELDKLECEMIKCAICLDPFSKPHIIECGHTFCYECLESWSKRPEGEGNGQCPTCRKHLVQKPILNLGMEQHVEFVVAKRHDTEAAKRIASANSGYKKLFFEDWKMPISVIRDEEDGVLRCGVCGWEIIDRNCARCSQQYAHISNSDHSDDSNERSSDEESLDSSEAGFIVSDDYLSAEERY